MQNVVTWPYRLTQGHSDNPAKGACAMDAVNWLVHGRHGDQPECACPIITNYVIWGNDAMSSKARQKLLPFLYRIAGSRSAEHEKQRVRVLLTTAYSHSMSKEAVRFFEAALNIGDKRKVGDLASSIIAAKAEDREKFGDSSAWDHYLIVLDQVLRAGPQGEPWSADTINVGSSLFAQACETNERTT